MLIRPTTTDDLPAVREITNHEILHGYAHFGTEAEPIETWRERFSQETPRYPWLVAEAAGEVLGYAKAGPWKPRQAYAQTVEVGVYVRTEAQGRGIGSSLYAELFARLAAAGFKTVLAGVALPNDASVRMHERAGMSRVGTLPRVGCKFGEWHDVAYFALHL